MRTSYLGKHGLHLHRWLACSLLEHDGGKCVLSSITLGTCTLSYCRVGNYTSRFQCSVSNLTVIICSQFDYYFKLDLSPQHGGFQRETDEFCYLGHRRYTCVLYMQDPSIFGTLMLVYVPCDTSKHPSESCSLYDFSA